MKHLSNYNILLQTYITTFGVNYFLCKVILAWAWFDFHTTVIFIIPS